MSKRSFVNVRVVTAIWKAIYMSLCLSCHLIFGFCLVVFHLSCDATLKTEEAI